MVLNATTSAYPTIKQVALGTGLQNEEGPSSQESLSTAAMPRLTKRAAGVPRVPKLLFLSTFLLR